MAKKRTTRATTKSTSKPSRTKPRSDDFNVLEHLTLKNVRLIEVTAKLEVVDGKLPNKSAIESNVTIGPSEAKGIILVDGFVKITGHPANSPDSSSILLISTHFQCVYRPESLAVEDCEKQLQVIAQAGMVIMWPHFREVIQSISGRMGLTPIVLPMFLSKAKGDGKGRHITLSEKPEKMSHVPD
jgi:hypothetical protein